VNGAATAIKSSMLTVTLDESGIASIERTSLASVACDIKGGLYYGNWKFTVTLYSFQLDINRIPCLQEQNANEEPRRLVGLHLFAPGQDEIYSTLCVFLDLIYRTVRTVVQ
jgi:hypothetical protein